MALKKLPIGIQTFKKVREDGFVYVDKTDLVYKLANGSQYNFLSRPRRFGKSMLLSTLQAYFEGRKELFEGLAIEKLETEWTKHPVLRFDMNNGAYQYETGVINNLNEQIDYYETQYGILKPHSDIASRFKRLIIEAHRQTGQKVVILVDEYEKPILETINKPELQEIHRANLKPFYANLKTCDEHIRFVFLTGVTKMGKLSIFSDLNNISNLSLDPRYAAICGFTKEQITEYFAEYLDPMAEKYSEKRADIVERLRKQYDGYRFSKGQTKVFNPFSLLNAFDKEEFGDYWFESGTPSFLVKILREHNFNLQNLEGEKARAEDLTEVDDNYSVPIPLLYQSGYLTIKEYYPERNRYLLGYPNNEVRRGFYESLLPNYVNTTKFSSRNYIDDIVDAAEDGDVENLMKQLQTLIAGIPSSPREKYEYLYRDSIYLIFRVLGFQVHSEVSMLTGRVDCMVETDGYVYILEFKLDESARAALDQIEGKDYTAPYTCSGKKLFKIGVNVDSSTRKMEWVCK